MASENQVSIKGRIVIFDDEVAMSRILVKTLGVAGYEAKAFTDPVEGMHALASLQPDVLLTDMRMPGMSGLEVLREVREQLPDVPVLIITAFGSVETAVEAMQAGAFNFITKPFQQNNLLVQIDRALEHRRVLQENARLSEPLPGSEVRKIIGKSEAISQVNDLIARSAPTDASVLVTGPSGVGKELVARAIHQQSPRHRKRFVAINCPSIPPSLIESEMFGHERGAFTGAERSKMGLVELSSGGTLFLDEIGELPLEIQVKLLRVLQEREIQRVGGLKQIPVDLRVIAATNRPLQEEMAKGRFREDLFFRLNVIQIEIPPLTKRLDDIPLLVDHFITGLRRRLHREKLALSSQALDALQQYHWPGNIRELENILERAAVLTSQDQIEVTDLAIDLRTPTAAPVGQMESTSATAPDGAFPKDYREARDQFERAYLRQVIEQANGNMTQVARISGISRRNIYDKIEKLGLGDELLNRK